MNKKIFLMALAAPALFAACTQEDVITNAPGAANNQNWKVAGDVEFVFDNYASTRMTWAPDGKAEEAIRWNDEADAFSMFYVEENSGAYKGLANALYKTEAGSKFTSENIVYEGNHVIVYPADYAHVSQKNIEVSIPNPQSASDDLGTMRTIAVSDLLSIKAPYTTKSPEVILAGKTPEQVMAEETKANGTIFAGGYGKAVNVPVNVLSSHMVLHLNFNLRKLDEIKVQSVKLVSNNNIFATAGNLLVNGDGFVSLVKPTTTNEITLAVDNAVVSKENSTYTAQISLLPPVAAALADATYAIQVKTNYGIVTINKALAVTNAAGKPQFKPFTVTVGDKTVAGEADETTLLSFDTEFTNISARDLDTDLDADGNQSEDAYGKRIIRNVVVDMAETSIANWPVANADELLDAYQMYDNLERTNAETFVLAGTEKVKDGVATYFEFTPAAVAEMAKHTNVSLSKGTNLDEIRLANGFTAAPDLAAVQNKSALDLIMNADNTWNLNVLQAANIMGWKSFTNKGNATLTASQNNASGTPITGDDLTAFNSVGGSIALNYNANYTDGIAYTTDANTSVSNANTITLTGNSTFNKLTANATLTLTGTNTINGLTVEGRLIVNGGTTTLSGTTNVKGSLLATTAGNLTNNGTVNVAKDDASIILTGQAATAVINLMTRTDNVSVRDVANQGYIKWTCNAETLTKVAEDVFNYAILNSDVKWEQELVIDHIQVAGSKVKVTGQATGLKNVFINANSTLVIPTGSSMTTDNTKGGYVEVYGIYTPTANDGTTIYDFN